MTLTVTLTVTLTATLADTARAWHARGYTPLPLRTDGSKLSHRVTSRLVVDDNDCWIWQGGCTTNGYGKVQIDSVTYVVHRITYEFYVSPIPIGLQLDHLCRVRRCANPMHVEPVTTRENLLRGETLAAANIAKTQCPQGHAYTNDNILWKRDGRTRACRECNRIYLAKRRETVA